MKFELFPLQIYIRIIAEVNQLLRSKRKQKESKLTQDGVGLRVEGELSKEGPHFRRAKKDMNDPVCGDDYIKNDCVQGPEFYARPLVSKNSSQFISCIKTYWDFQRTCSGNLPLTSILKWTVVI